MFKKNILIYGATGSIGESTLNLIRDNKEKINHKILDKLKLSKKGYFLLTLHRPDMVDNKKNLNKLMKG